MKLKYTVKENVHWYVTFFGMEVLRTWKIDILEKYKEYKRLEIK